MFQIHISTILQEKAPKLAKKLPRFVVRAFEKLVCQDECNQALQFIGDKTGVEAMQGLSEFFDLRIAVEGLTDIPQDGRFIFASNHPLGGLDGICLSSVLGAYYQHQIKYIVNDILYYIEPLQPIFLPINKHGNQSKQQAVQLNEAFASAKQIITFPAGLCSRKQGSKIVDTEWKKMFVLKAIEHQRDIVPVYFGGKNSRFFYNLATLRKKWGIKMNVEMLFLPSEMFKQRNKRLLIRFGKPIPWQSLHSNKTAREWANWVKDEVYKLEN